MDPLGKPLSMLSSAFVFHLYYKYITSFFIIKKLPPFTLAGLDLTTLYFNKQTIMAGSCQSVCIEVSMSSPILWFPTAIEGTHLRRSTHRLIDSPTQWLTDSPMHRLTNAPTHHFTDSQTHKLSPTHELTDKSTHRLTDSSTHRLTDSPTHRLTDSSTHLRRSTLRLATWSISKTVGNIIYRLKHILLDIKSRKVCSRYVCSI
jgi:hypothetical protein